MVRAFVTRAVANNLDGSVTFLDGLADSGPDRWLWNTSSDWDYPGLISPDVVRYFLAEVTNTGMRRLFVRGTDGVWTLELNPGVGCDASGYVIARDGIFQPGTLLDQLYGMFDPAMALHCKRRVMSLTCAASGIKAEFSPLDYKAESFMPPALAAIRSSAAILSFGVVLPIVGVLALAALRARWT